MELYLRNYVEALPVSLFSQDIKNAVPSAVLCFNYTHTFFKKYGSFFPKAKIHYIHGESRDSDTSETSNMVLGIDEYYKIPEDCNGPFSTAILPQHLPNRMKHIDFYNIKGLKTMKRRVFLIGTVALLLGGAAITVFTQKKKQEPVLQQIEYSNFTDMDTQTLLTDLLHEADVSDTRIQIFMNHVQRFNQDMKADWLTAGFETAEPLDLKYDPYDGTYQAERTEQRFRH